MGIPPRCSDTAVIPGTSAISSCKRRSWTRIASGVSLESPVGKATPKYKTFLGLKPGFTLHNCPRLRSMSPASHAANGATPFLQCFLETRLHQPQCWSKSKENSGKNRNRESENHHATVQANFFGAGQTFRQKPKRALGSPAREEQSQTTTAQRKQHPFGEKLPDDAQPAGAQRGANGKLARSLHGAGQLKIRDVHACD